MPSIPDQATADGDATATQPRSTTAAAELPQPSPTDTVTATAGSASPTAANTVAVADQATSANSKGNETAQTAEAAVVNGLFQQHVGAEVQQSSADAESTAPVTSPSGCQQPEHAAASTITAAVNGAAPAADGATPAVGGIAAPGGGSAENGGSPAGSGFVFNAAAVARLTSILKQYEGTHNFHNFTVRLEATDPSAKRYMLSCKCDGVFQIQVHILLFFCMH